MSETISKERAVRLLFSRWALAAELQCTQAMYAVRLFDGEDAISDEVRAYIERAVAALKEASSAIDPN